MFIQFTIILAENTAARGEERIRLEASPVTVRLPLDDRAFRSGWQCKSLRACVAPLHSEEVALRQASGPVRHQEARALANVVMGAARR